MLGNTQAVLIGVQSGGSLYPTLDKIAEYTFVDGLFVDLVGSADGTNQGTTAANDRFGVADAARAHDGTSYVEVNGLLTPLAALTQGAIVVWEKNNSSATEKMFFSLSRNVNSTFTEMAFYVDHRAGVKRYTMYCYVDGVAQWSARSVDGTSTPDEGVYTNMILSHDGVAPVLHRNGVSLAITFSITTDKTCWFKDVITDATSPADVCSIGTTRRNGSLAASMIGDIDDVVLYSTSQAANALSIYNGSKP